MTPLAGELHIEQSSDAHTVNPEHELSEAISEWMLSDRGKPRVNTVFDVDTGEHRLVTQAVGGVPLVKNGRDVTHEVAGYVPAQEEQVPHLFFRALFVSIYVSRSMRLAVWLYGCCIITLTSLSLATHAVTAFVHVLVLL